MKIKKTFTLEILRWNPNELKYAKQIKEIDDQMPFTVCSHPTHENCKHDDGDVVLRNQVVESVSFYPNSKRLTLWTKKREGKS